MTETAMNIYTRALPAGWKWVKLGDASELKNGYAFDSSSFSNDTGIPLIRIRDLKTNDPSVFFQGDYSDEHLVTPGSLLIGMDGEFRCYRWAGPVALQNQRVCQLLPKVSVLDPDFLFYSINDYLVAIENQTAFTTVKHISSRQIQNISLPLPPLKEQERIAALLNNQMAAVEKAKKSSEERIEAAEALPASYLREVFKGIVPISIEADPSDAPIEWKWQLLTDVTRLESGHTPSRKHPEYWENGDIPWLALPDIRAVDGKRCEITSEYTNDLGISHSSARILPEGTVALSRTASVGFATIFGRPMATSQDFVNWVCSSELLPEFLLLALISSRDYIRSLSSGATHKTVYVPTVKSFRICMPSSTVQEQLSKEYLGNRDSINPISANIQQELQTIEAMPASLLREALAGEL